MPRFVILEHDHPYVHWDLLLESGPVLRAWRLEAFPCDKEIIASVASFDHRLIYLDYEGPISGDRGRVIRSEHGTFDWEVHEANRIVARLHGTRLCGVLRLDQTEEDKWDGKFLSETNES
jgi:hypothetical protein